MLSAWHVENGGAKELDSEHTASVQSPFLVKKVRREAS
jgi:hypothetical protein